MLGGSWYEAGMLPMSRFTDEKEWTLLMSRFADVTIDNR